MIWVLLLLAVPDLTPEQVEAVQKIISNIQEAINSQAPAPSAPPRFAPLGSTDSPAGVPPIGDKSFTGGGNADSIADGVVKSPKANSQKRCLCGPECGCGGNCDPCTCLFNKLPEPGPGPLLSAQPLVEQKP